MTIAGPGVMSSIWAQPHLMEIDYKIVYIIIPHFQLIQGGALSVTGESMCTKYWSTALSKLAKETCD